MWAGGLLGSAAAESEPSTAMTVVALLVFGLACFGAGTLLRRGGKALSALAKSNADAKAAARAAAAGGDARSLAAVDVGGVHVHTGPGQRLATGHDDIGGRAATGEYDDERGGRYVINGGVLHHVDAYGNVRALGSSTGDESFVAELVGRSEHVEDASALVVGGVSRPGAAGRVSAGGLNGHEAQEPL